MANESGSLVGEYSDLCGTPTNRFTSNNKINEDLEKPVKTSKPIRSTLPIIPEDNRGDLFGPGIGYLINTIVGIIIIVAGISYLSIRFGG